MISRFARPMPLVLLLGFCTSIPVMMAGVRVVQIPLGTLPDDSLRLAVAPLSFFAHALAGVLFGILGPLQFSRVLRRRFGPWHRITGRVFAVAGVFLGLSGLSILAQAQNTSTLLLDGFRAVAGIGLLAAIGLGVSAARTRDFPRHRAWMIRAYGIGMGSGTVALVMFPIYIATGAPITGLLSEVVFVGWWALNVALAEWIARRTPFSSSQISSGGTTLTRVVGGASPPLRP
jgi:hypothetical protein